MQALVIVDMQRWMFRQPERARQLPAVVSAISRLAESFAAARRPIFNVGVVHKPDRSTWTRLMLKYDQPCMIEGTADVEPVDGLRVRIHRSSLASNADVSQRPPPIFWTSE